MLSGCCCAEIIMGDICSECREHCDAWDESDAIVGSNGRMQMNYQIWYRQNGTKVWAPWSINGFVSIFASKEIAQSNIDKLKKAFTNEFQIFECKETDDQEGVLSGEREVPN